MTTILIAQTATGHFQVFANYEGEGDRFTFAFRDCITRVKALAYATWLAALHGVDPAAIQGR